MRRLGFLVLLAFFAAAVPAVAAKPKARGSVQQVYATGLEPGAKTVLEDASGKDVAGKRATRLGGVVFRKVKPGRGYRLLAGGEASKPVRVMSARPKPPSTKGYDQEIPEKGYGYMRMRDGTKLAYSVRPAAGEGPHPTLIEYSGYGYARPSSPQSGIAALANLVGFTVVDVNMRGTGCSGGAFDYFDRLQRLDGYDIVETVARQPWVKHNKVGMFGISYGGISQMYVAQTRPPSLAAITPLSVIDQTQTTLYPGGVLNTGFALSWAQDRMDDAQPAGPDAGQEWAYERIQQGDETCKANQVLHANRVDLIAKNRRNATYRPKVADPLAPVTFVDDIEVPVFMACQWTDEQTGGHCPTLASRFTGTDRKWFTFTNGVHTDSLDPATFNRLYDFLKIYVDREAPKESEAPYRNLAPLIYQTALGIPDAPSFPADPIQQQPTLAAAKQAFEALPSVRILFDNGAGGAPGYPYAGYERSFKRWPAPGTQGRRWYLNDNGLLDGGKPSAAGSDAFTWDQDKRPATNFTGDSGAGSLWTATPPYKWVEPPAGSASSYVTEPLTQDVTALGGGFVKLWIKSSRKRVDLQATISEVRPDGKETFVQGGWLRGDAAKLDAKKSTFLAPVLSLRKRDLSPLPANRFVPVTIPLYYQGHGYRAGSRVRVSVTAPSGDQPIWSFGEAKPKGTAKVVIARSAKRPSQLVLPTLKGAKGDIPTPLPPCPGLRGEPCRTYAPAGG